MSNIFNEINIQVKPLCKETIFKTIISLPFDRAIRYMIEQA